MYFSGESKEMPGGQCMPDIVTMLGMLGMKIHRQHD